MIRLGDRFKVIDNSVYYGYGKVGTVTEITPDKTIILEFSNGERRGYMLNSLRPVIVNEEARKRRSKG